MNFWEIWIFSWLFELSVSSDDFGFESSFYFSFSHLFKQFDILDCFWLNRWEIKMKFNIRFLSNSSRMIMKQFYQNSLEIYGCNFSLSLFITIFFSKLWFVDWFVWIRNWLKWCCFDRNQGQNPLNSRSIISHRIKSTKTIHFNMTAINRIALD